MSRKLLLGTLMGFLIGAMSSGRAQLADTIWEGNVILSGLTLQKVQAGVLQSGPNLSNASLTLPVEIWFWNNSNCGVVFRRDKWGLNPEEFAYMSDVDLEGNLLAYEVPWYRQGPKYVGGGSRSPSYVNSTGHINATDSYTYNASKKTGTFTQRLAYVVANSTFNAGTVMSITGNFRLANANTLVPQKVVFSLTPSLVGSNSYRTSGRLTLRTSNFIKTNRQPSSEKDVQPGFDDYYYSKAD